MEKSEIKLESEITEDDCDTPKLRNKESNLSTSSEPEESIAKLIDDDPIVVHKHFFHIKQHSENDYISALGFSDKLI